MSRLDLDEDDAPSRGGTGRVRPRAAGRAKVRALVARLGWTEMPLVYWTGRPATDGPAATAVQARLAGLAPGVYAVRVVSKPSDEDRDAVRLARMSAVALDAPIAITPAVMASSVRSLLESRGFPRLLPTVVDDADAWRTRCEAAVQRARTALDAVLRGQSIDRICLVLGRRDAALSERRGSALASSLPWPADVLAEAERIVGAARIRQLARAVPGTADPAVAAAVRGRLLVAPQRLGEFLDALPDLIALHARLADEPVRRLRAVATIQGQAVTFALGRSAVGGPIALGNGRPTKQERAFLGLIRQRYVQQATDAVHAYYAAVLPGQRRRAIQLPQRAGERRGHVSLLGLLTDLFVARGLRSALLAGELRADRRRYLNVAKVAGRPVAAGPDGRPLAFDTLPAAAVAAVWADATARPWPRQPLPLSAVLDPAAADAISTIIPWGWVEACCHVWPVGATGLGPAMAALLSLAAVRRAPGIAAMLERFAAPTLSHVLMDLGLMSDAHRARRRVRFEGELNLFARCATAGLTADDLRPFFSCDALDLLRHAIDICPNDLQPFGRSMGAYLAEWTAGSSDRHGSAAAWSVSAYAASMWARAFTRLGARLLDLCVRVGSPPGEATTLVHAISWNVDRLPDDRQTLVRAVMTAMFPSFRRRLAAASDAAARDRVFDHLRAAVTVVATADVVGLAAARQLFAACFDGVPSDGKAMADFLPDLTYRDQVAVAALALGRPDRLVALSRLPSGDDGGAGISPVDAVHVAAGWAVLRGLGSSVAQGVSAAVGREGLTLRAVRAVARLGLCLRFHRGDDLRAALAGVARDVAQGDADAEQLAELSRWRGSLPGRVRDIVDRPEALRRELAGLSTRPTLSPAAARRVEHLRGQLADPAALAEWVRRDLEKVLPAAVDEARVARLEGVAEAAIRGHFRDVLGVVLPATLSGPARRNWDNALRLYQTVDDNRTRLRWLLRREARGDRAWLATEPRNAAFLATVAKAGVDVAAWRGPMVRRVTDGSGRRLRIELETDPLHVLQMGNYFGTCLSEGQMNAFSTIANATDANKRVAYVYDEAAGNVVGRKLLAMTPRGQIVGFRTYGTGDRPDADPRAGEPARARLKVLLDAFCAELARQCGGTLHPFEHRKDATAVPTEDLTLSAKWYNDGPEPFDVRAAGRRVRK